MLPQELAREQRDRLREEAWCLLDTALLRLVRWHAARLGAVGPEEAEDIAAEKALDLLTRAEAGKWDTSHRTGAEIVAFLSNVARNGLVDRLRLRSRVRVLGDDLEAVADSAAREGHIAPTGDPSAPHEARQYAEQLQSCVAKLSPRARVMWFLRVLHEWPSLRIAAHPDVALKPAHVDVELQRARGAVRVCMEHAGFDIRHIPPGVFAALWSSVMADRGGADAAGEESP